MKLIAITQRLIKNQSYYEVRDALDSRWAELFKKLGYIPLVLPMNYDFRVYFRRFDIDGIILSGGNDLVSFRGDELSAERDDFEKKLLGFAIRNKILILGLCRGMLLIGDYFKSTFHRISGHVGVRHNIVVSPESRMKAVLKKIGSVNSFHNYAINEAGGGLLVSARSSDGTIEAVEHEKYLIFGQMWHSERELPYSSAEIAVIKECLSKKPAFSHKT